MPINTDIDKSKYPLCLVKALIHLGTITGTVNITFLCYFLYLMELKTNSYCKSLSFQIVCYVLNWIIIGLFVFFYAFADIHINELACCRFKLGQPVTTANTIYSGAIIFLTFIVYFVLRCHIKSQINQLEPDTTLKTNFTTAINYFIIVVLLALIKLTSFFLNGFFFFRVADRLFENLYGLILFSLLGIGKENINQLLCSPKETNKLNDSMVSLDLGTSEPY